MSLRLLALAPLVALLVSACTKSSTEPALPDDSANAASSTANTAKAGTPANPPDGARVAANSPLAGKDERAGTVRIFAGDDPGKTIPITTKQAWTVGPGDSWTIGLYDFVRTDGTKNVFKGPDGEPDFAIPGAYTQPADRIKGLKKGAPVLVPDDSGKDTICGRIVRTRETDSSYDLDKFGDTSPVEATYKDNLVIPLEGKLSFGAPVAFKNQASDASYSLGWLVYQDGKTAWLMGATRVAVSLVKPVEVQKIYKVGEKVWAVPQDQSLPFTQGSIEKVERDGLLYHVKFADGKTRVADMCGVTSTLP